ncbi:MAG TPA: hypothetical protein VL371_16050 [Gemmataceae bacterium]|nr:hypothetical protein [Gemmataceae bacterium]
MDRLVAMRFLAHVVVLRDVSRGRIDDRQIEEHVGRKTLIADNFGGFGGRQVQETGVGQTSDSSVPQRQHFDFARAECERLRHVLVGLGVSAQSIECLDPAEVRVPEK